MKRLLWVMLLAAACGKTETKAPPTEAQKPPALTPPAAAAAADAAPATAAPAAPAAARPGGPSVEACEKAADHLKSLVVESVVGSTAQERAYVAQLIDKDRDKVVRYCLEIAVVKEIECVNAAPKVENLVGCERMRREITPELAMSRELSQADCAKFFDRLRQFKLAEGVAPAEIDKDRDQIIRACQEKAKPGTVACFIASPTYEQARRCP